MMFWVNVWWCGIVIFIAILWHHLGKKIGRREGYAEGHRHGMEDALKHLGVPVARARDRTLFIDLSRMVEEELAVARAAARKDRPS